MRIYFIFASEKSALRNSMTFSGTVCLIRLLEFFPSSWFSSIIHAMTFVRKNIARRNQYKILTSKHWMISIYHHNWFDFHRHWNV